MATTPDPTDSSSGPGTGTAKAGPAGAAKPGSAKPGAAAAKKAARSSGRFTPKGAKDQGVVRAGGAAGAAAAKPTSGRYTPPAAPAAAAEAQQLTKPWVAPLMFAFFIIGLLLIVLNYLEAVLPSAPSNWYLLGGILAISGGFLTATKLY